MIHEKTFLHNRDGTVQKAKKQSQGFILSVVLPISIKKYGFGERIFIRIRSTYKITTGKRGIIL
jgi:hypothetical protein